VVLGYSPAVAPAGTWTVTSNSQVSPPGRLPLDSVSSDVPLIVEPAPQTSFSGKPTATRPLNVPSSSSVKLIPVACSLRSKLPILKRSVAVPPGGTGSSRNDFCRWRMSASACRVATATPEDTNGPPGLAVSSPLILSSCPRPYGTTSTETVQVVLAGSNPLRMLTEEPPGSAVKVAPVQSVDAIVGDAISSVGGC